MSSKFHIPITVACATCLPPSRPSFGRKGEKKYPHKAVRGLGAKLLRSGSGGPMGWSWAKGVFGRILESDEELLRGKMGLESWTGKG